MENNPTVERFRKDMTDLAHNFAQNFHELLLKQASEIVTQMKASVPVDSGALRSSIRSVDVSRNYGALEVYSVLVIAGGAGTLKRSSNGNVYDYSVATEFGTQKEAPEPFFYNTFRAYLGEFKDQAQETLEETIAENNQVRALRSENASSSAAAGRSPTNIYQSVKR